MEKAIKRYDFEKFIHARPYRLEFIKKLNDSMSEYGMELSEKQIEVLQQIYEDGLNDGANMMIEFISPGGLGNLDNL